LSDSEKEVYRVVESYKAAVLAADPEAFMRLYHPGAAFLTPGASGSTTALLHGSAPWKVGSHPWEVKESE